MQGNDNLQMQAKNCQPLLAVLFNLENYRFGTSATSLQRVGFRWTRDLQVNEFIFDRSIGKLWLYTTLQSTVPTNKIGVPIISSDPRWTATYYCWKTNSGDRSPASLLQLMASREWMRTASSVVGLHRMGWCDSQSNIWFLSVGSFTMITTSIR